MNRISGLWRRLFTASRPFTTKSPKPLRFCTEIPIRRRLAILNGLTKPAFLVTLLLTILVDIYAFYSRQWGALAGSVLLTVLMGQLVESGSRPEDPYGSFHHNLNRLPGEPRDRPPKTEWLNQGYWKDTKVFREACQALALKLYKQAGYESGAHVLDVGYGSGESLVFQLTTPLLPRPSSLTGITTLKKQYDRSQERVGHLLEDTGINVPVVLYHGDAIYRPGATNHPLDPSSTSTPFTLILALDCAYHFRSRRDFLAQSLKRLRPGGRIGLADICLEDSVPGNSWVRRVLAGSGMTPAENLVSMREYESVLRKLGYEDVKIEDISADVYPGFFAFLSPRGVWWWVFTKVMGLLVKCGIRFVIVTASSPAQSS